jgi:hypothetical protein
LLALLNTFRTYEWTKPLGGRASWFSHMGSSSLSEGLPYLDKVVFHTCTVISPLAEAMRFPAADLLLSCQME